MNTLSLFSLVTKSVGEFVIIQLPILESGKFDLVDEFNLRLLNMLI